MQPALRLRFGRALAVAAVLMLLVRGAVAVPPAGAQLGPVTPPARLFGSVTVDGFPAAGAPVVAYIGGTVCGQTGVAFGGGYQLDVASGATQFGCGTDGALISFTIGGLPARESAVFANGAFIQRDLSVATFERVARVSVERWAPYSNEPCARPSDGWCISTYRLPPAPEPFARYRMLATLRDGRVVQPAGWVTVSPGIPTDPVRSEPVRGVERVVWERWTFARLEPCRGRVENGWCVERVGVPPPVTSTVWYRLLVHQPDGTAEDPTGFIPASP